MVKTLPNNNYLIRKLQTNLTQILHTIKLRPFTSSHKLPDISIPSKDFQQDNEVAIQHDDLYALAWQENYQPLMIPPPLRSQTTESNVSHPDPERKQLSTYPDPPTTDPMQEPQHVIDDVETQEDSPNPKTPHEPEDATQTPKKPTGNQSTIFGGTQPQTGTRISPTTMLFKPIQQSDRFKQWTSRWPRITSFGRLRPRRRPEIRKLKKPQALTWTALLRLYFKSPQSTMALSHTPLLYDSVENDAKAKK